MNATGEPARLIHPRYAAQHTAAVPVKVRSPDTRPIRKVSNTTRPILMMFFPDTRESARPERPNDRETQRQRDPTTVDAIDDNTYAAIQLIQHSP
jgi:hypothetical protein